MPESLDVAVTDAPDSIAEWLSARGGYRIWARAGDTVRLVTSESGSGPSLVVHRVRARDARDAIDAGVDVLLTSDPDAVSYAATRSDLASMPLAWDRTYVLLVPTRASRESAMDVSPRLDTLRAELATGAVRVEARAASALSSGDSGMCVGAGPSNAGSPVAVRRPPRIVFARGDDVSRAIAARLVALGAGPGMPLAALAPSLAARGDSLRAAGVDPGDVERVLDAGQAAAAVLAVAGRPIRACRAEAATAARSPMDTVPLIQTRARLIARRSLTGRPLEALLRAATDSSRGGP